MAVLKQTSPTACPSAPSPKPSSTVPSASTRSAVGLWSGQGAAFFDVVMGGLHRGTRSPRQSRSSGFTRDFRIFHRQFRGLNLKFRVEHDPEKWRPVFGKDHAQSI